MPMTGERDYPESQSVTELAPLVRQRRVDALEAENATLKKRPVGQSGFIGKDFQNGGGHEDSKRFEPEVEKSRDLLAAALGGLSRQAQQAGGAGVKRIGFLLSPGASRGPP